MVAGGESGDRVQPRPPDVAELLRVVEELRERESRLRTQLLEQKLLKETVAIVPFLEREIAAKSAEIERSRERAGRLEAENAELRAEVEALRSGLRAEEEMRRGREEKLRAMEAEVGSCGGGFGAERGRFEKVLERSSEATDECSSSSSQMLFQGLIDASSNSNLLLNMRIAQIHRHFPQCGDSEASWHRSEGGDWRKRSDAASSLQQRRHHLRRAEPSSEADLVAADTSTSSSSSSSAAAPERDELGKGPGELRLPRRRLRRRRGIEVVGGGGAVRAPRARGGGVLPLAHAEGLAARKRAGAASDAASSSAASARDMIGEIENRSAHLLAIKTEVETQGDFVNFLIKEVEGPRSPTLRTWSLSSNGSTTSSRACGRAEGGRAARGGVRVLRSEEARAQAAAFRDEPRQPRSSALKKMQALLEKLEHGVYNLARVREGATNRYKGFQIPWEWMLDSGIISQLSEVSKEPKENGQVATEPSDKKGHRDLDAHQTSISETRYEIHEKSVLRAPGLSRWPEEEELMLQGVRFAFRVHQFAGGFDVETMRAFQELKDKASSFHTQSQSQHQQQKLICRAS
uniref:Uncharacterized protein n=1 Tax=Ananas comosus var. bracteatus TaxID=296719 RepID=A0A6V7PTP2_ANACO|nr:unnamed protein product [Ananas comosus var. bracteatus]